MSGRTISLEERCRLAFLAGIRDHEERFGRPLTDDEFRRALARYPASAGARTGFMPGQGWGSGLQRPECLLDHTKLAPNGESYGRDDGDEHDRHDGKAK